jgi:hypothetical protein
MPPEHPAGILTDPGIPTGDRTALAELLVDAYLTGVTRGREELADEQNADYPPARIWHMGTWADQVDERRRWHATARDPRPNDHPGGAVDVW